MYSSGGSKWLISISTGGGLKSLIDLTNIVYRVLDLLFIKVGQVANLPKNK
jgi:hypothetical protein